MEPITMQQFFIIWACVLAGMLACRCLPMFLLRGRELSEDVAWALNMIPPTAFAALVANDLLTPGMFANGLWPAALPLVAALVVLVVARVSKSLVWSGVAGVAVYAALTYLLP